MATLTIADLDNGKRDLETVDAVANSQADTTPTRYGDQVLTLAGALRRLGYQPPVAYAPGLNVDSRTMTVEKDGVVYRPDPELVPFTTGAWNPVQWRVIQNTDDANLVYRFSTLAEAQSAAVTLPEGATVLSPDASGRPSRFEVSAGTLSFVEHSGETATVHAAAGFLALPEYASSVIFTASGVGGTFVLDATDSSTPANNATVYVDQRGRRFKRLDAGVVNPRWWGAKGDYLLPDGSVNTTPTPDQDAINAAYLYAVKVMLPLELHGNFYITGGLVFSARNSANFIPRISGSGVLYANLDSSSSSSAVYVGDDTTNGVYQLHIVGHVHIQNVGAVKVGKRGYHAQDAAYSKANVTASGWDVGAYIQGVIHSELGGSNMNFLNNNLDLLVESFRSTNPVAILRFACNMVQVKDVGLGSRIKCRVVVGPSVPAGPTQTTGGLISFENVRFEGEAGGFPGYNETIYVESLGEVVPNYTGDIVFRDCWFEAFDKTRPLMAIQSGKAILERCFIANRTNDVMFVLNNDSSYISFRDTNSYFADGQPNIVVYGGAGSTSVHRGNIEIRESVFFGPSGVIPRIHGGMRNEYRYSYFNEGIVVLKLGTAVRASDGAPSMFPENATDEYMTNGTLDVADLVQTHFGPVKSARVFISSTDGASEAYTELEFRPGGGVRIVHQSGPAATLSGSVLSFPTTLTAAFYKPTVEIRAAVKTRVQPTT